MILSAEDRKVLRVLQSNGRISNVDLARRVHMSESACLRRTKAMEEAGVIAGYRAEVNAAAIGYGISSYVLVNLDQRAETDAQKFFEAVAHEPRIIECVAVTGGHDLILRVVSRDIEDLADITMAGILRHPSVKDIASCVVLKELKRNNGIVS